MTSAKELIEYFRSLGLEVNTTTKARGHLGFFREGRIDISKDTPKDKLVPTLLHEFTHYIHSKIEKDVAKTGGTLEVIFKQDNVSEIFEELIQVTHFVDKNSLHLKLLKHKEHIKLKIKELDKEIKKEYPKFQRSKKFSIIEKIIKKSNAKYLLKYDRVMIKGWLFQKTKIYSIENIEKDFPELKPSLIAYIKLKSYQKKQAKISQKINKLNKYYERPTEIFSRFIEGLYIDKKTVKSVAPKSSDRFFELLAQNYYKELRYVIESIVNL